MMKSRLMLILLPAVLVVAGCTDDNPLGGAGGIDCSVPTSCGGDVVATWAFQGYCGMPLKGLNCPGATYEAGTYHSTLPFQADGTYSGAASGTARLVLPLSCFAADGGIAGSCGGAAPFDTCSVSGGNCVCDQAAQSM